MDEQRLWPCEKPSAQQPGRYESKDTTHYVVLDHLVALFRKGEVLLAVSPRLLLEAHSWQPSREVGH